MKIMYIVIVLFLCSCSGMSEKNQKILDQVVTTISNVDALARAMCRNLVGSETYIDCIKRLSDSFGGLCHQ